MSNSNKLGPYIQQLMGTVVDKDQEDFVKNICLDELKRLGSDISSFVAENLVDDTDQSEKTVKKLLQEQQEENSYDK